MHLKILSWNIWFDSPDFADICEYLKNNPADIIGLQEVSDDPNMNIVEYLTKLGYNYVYTPAAVARGHGKQFGNAVFSKYEIVGKTDYVLSKEKSRNAIRADVRVGNQILHVYSTHLLHVHQEQSEIQEEQTKTLLENLTKDYTLVMGDFNATPASKSIEMLREVLVDNDLSNTPTWCMYPEGCPICYPGGLNTRLDYIFLSKDIKLLSSKVDKTKGSDHLPITIEIEI